MEVKHSVHSCCEVCCQWRQQNNRKRLALERRFGFKEIPDSNGSPHIPFWYWQFNAPLKCAILSMQYIDNSIGNQTLNTVQKNWVQLLVYRKKKRLNFYKVLLDLFKYHCNKPFLLMYVTWYCLNIFPEPIKSWCNLSPHLTSLWE